MRLLFLTNFYPPHDIGGYEQWCQEVAVRLVKRGHMVSVLTSRYGLRPDSETGELNVKRSLYLQANNDYYQPAHFFFRRPTQERANLKALDSQIKLLQPDSIMVWGMWNLSLSIPYHAEQWLPDRVAYFISSYWPMDTDLHTQYWKLPTKRNLFNILKRPLRTIALTKLRMEDYPPKLRFARAVCCSHYVRNILVEAGRLPAQAGVLYGGTDPKPFLMNSSLNKPNQNLLEGPLRLLYFGRLIHDKGVHTAVEALGQLKEQGLTSNLELTILGSGHPDYEALLQNLVLQLDIADLVHFIKKVPREEMPAWLGQFNVCLFTSIWPEPMARSVMEAMAAGLMVIGTEVGGQTEMLTHGQNALTFKAEDSQTLAAHILAIAADPRLRIRLARAGQKLVLERFTLTRMVDEIEQYLAKIVTDTSPQSPAIGS